MIDPSAALILNVDDTEAARYTKTRNLRRAGFKVAEAQSGMEALRQVEDLRPAVVLLDVQMPDMDGIEVCRRIKRCYPEVLVLQTSATFTSGADRTRGLDSGADSYLTQPIEPDELIAAVRALLRIKAAEDELRRLNSTLEQRVQERTRELAAANEKLRSEIAQRLKAEAALIQAQKMEAIGHLTGGIAHDFNNLLTAVVGNLDLIRSRSTEPRIVRLAESAFKAAERGSRLTSQLLAFSRTQKLATRPVDVNRLISGLVELLEQSIGPAVAVRTQLDPRLHAAVADATQLELAILNLGINARDAMPEGGTVTLSTSALHLDEDEEHLAAGDYVVVSVSDTGVGMPPDVLARAFDPFFTTKPAGKGTGLGLSQVYGIAKQSGGIARIVSHPGQGTAVSILLPYADDAVVHEIAPHDENVHGRNFETVLVIDDDPDVRALVAEFLAELGYEVLHADNAESGFEMLGRLTPDLLIVDYAMPGINGAEVARAVRKRLPDLPILFLSGYADTSALEAAVGPAPLLRKPFRPWDLAAAVRTILNASSASGRTAPD